VYAGLGQLTPTNSESLKLESRDVVEIRSAGRR
jgi:hypothetical protein